MLILPGQCRKMCGRQDHLRRRNRQKRVHALPTLTDEGTEIEAGDRVERLTQPATNAKVDDRAVTALLAVEGEGPDTRYRPARCGQIHGDRAAGISGEAIGKSTGW